MIRTLKYILLLFLLSETAFAQKYSSASSLWLNYQNTVNKADIISIDFEIDSTALYTYYASLVWNNGYAGVQRAGAGFFKHVHFSLWDPEGMTSTVIWHADDVRVERFGGEGTGWKAMWNFHWKEHKPYRLMVKLTAAGGKSNYDAWFFDFEKYHWKHLAIFQYPIKKDFDYLESFIEDFGGTAENYRAYSLFNARQRSTVDSSWHSFPLAEYNINGDNPNCNGSVVNNKFKLETGGTISSGNPSGTVLMTMPDEFSVSVPKLKEILVVPNSKSGSLKFTWNYVDNLWAPQANFNLIISEDSLFSNIIHNSGIIISSDTSYIVPNLQIDTTRTYYIKLNVNSIFDKSDEMTGSFRNYIVTDINTESVPTDKYTLSQNYPNPFGKSINNSFTTVDFFTPKDAFVNLSVYDILGEKILTVADNYFHKGEHKMKINFRKLNNLSSGIYFYLLRVADRTIAKKMLFLR
jgi:hypothetical protein